MSQIAPESVRPDANATVASNVRAELARADLGQVDLANHLGHNEMWMSRRLRSNPPFSPNEIQAVADYFGIEPGDLFVVHERRAVRMGSGAGRRNLVFGDFGQSGPNQRPKD